MNHFYMVVEAIEDYGTGDFRVLAAVDTMEEALRYIDTIDKEDFVVCIEFRCQPIDTYI